MGYRAYVNKKRIVEYGEGVFNYCSQDLADFLYQLKDEMIEDFNYCPFAIDDDFGGLKDEWEIEKEWLEGAIKYMKENKKPDDEAFSGYTYRNIIDNFEYWLDESKEKDNFSDSDFVYVNWF